ncbi:MAG: transporter, ATP-binding protein, partial [Proteobacteria bacterium]|nr:transporter, ATP-binding protein [Pseudomonadota bacterium]
MTAIDLAIDVRALNKRFGDKHVVKDLSLQVRQGEIYGFLGPNGSGKTTSIRMLCGLLTPDSGEGTCLGFDLIRQTARIKREVGYMTQRFSLWEDLTIRENMEFIARMYGMKERRQAVSEAIDRLGLASRQNQLAGALSGG